MLEAVVLDMLEQQNKVLVPSLQSISSKYWNAGAPTTGTTAQFLYVITTGSFLSAGLNGVRWCPISRVWLVPFPTNPSGYLVMSFNIDTETFATEDTARGLSQFFEDNSGVIWAVSNNAGYYGLWKRTGVGAWTQALADTSNTNILCRWSTGAIYYRSSAGNFYILSSGAASVTSDPGATTYSGWYSYQNTAGGGRSRVPGVDITISPTPSSGAPTAQNDTGTYDPANDQFWIWRWPDRTRVCVKPMELYQFMGTEGYSATINNIVYYPVADAPNYVLGVWIAAVGHLPSAGQYGAMSYVGYSLVNISTGKTQYIGRTKIPYLSSAGVVYTADGLAPVIFPYFVSMNNGNLRIYFLGQLYAGTAGSTNTGFLRQELTATIKI